MKTMPLLMTAFVLSACGGNVMEEEQGSSTGGSAGGSTGGSAGGSTGGSAGGSTGGSAGGSTGGSTGGSAGGSTGGSAGGSTGGTGGAMPDHCAVETSLPGPHQVKFSFVSKNLQPVYLLDQCRILMQVKSCADDYQLALATTADCTVDCSDPPVGGCIACDACMSFMVPVSISTSAEAFWHGKTYTFDTNSDGCTCHNTFEAPAGKYRLEVPVYLTSEPYESDPIHIAVVDFTLPAPNDKVTVDLTEAYPED
jgi:hypothetical protein